MNPYAIITAIGLVIAATIGGYFKGRDDANTAWELRLAEQAELAREREKVLQEKANGITDNLQADRDRIAAQRDDALERLRERSRRRQDPSRADCKGSTGAELSAEDGQFLVREAARADRLRSALEACYQWADSVTK